MSSSSKTKMCEDILLPIKKLIKRIDKQHKNASVEERKQEQADKLIQIGTHVAQYLERFDDIEERRKMRIILWNHISIYSEKTGDKLYKGFKRVLKRKTLAEQAAAAAKTEEHNQKKNMDDNTDVPAVSGDEQNELVDDKVVKSVVCRTDKDESINKDDDLAAMEKQKLNLNPENGPAEPAKDCSSDQEALVKSKPNKSDVQKTPRKKSKRIAEKNGQQETNNEDSIPKMLVSDSNLSLKRKRSSGEVLTLAKDQGPDPKRHARSRQQETNNEDSIPKMLVSDSNLSLKRKRSSGEVLTLAQGPDPKRHAGSRLVLEQPRFSSALPQRFASIPTKYMMPTGRIPIPIPLDSKPRPGYIPFRFTVTPVKPTAFINLNHATY